ncbi:MAG TPA: metalloregulator ArsR/SmtB family transcription factor [Pseudolabrys sp.]|nr:metalloregulator ArsR/SmtB family transcription factor [Pseudolabrys sp.]
MVKYDDQGLDRVFAALADPTRRALLARLYEHDGLSVSELAKPFPVTIPAIMKHLAVLSDAGLITRHKTGRIVACQLTAAPMEDAMNWLTRYQRFWTRQLDRLAAFVENDPCPPQHPPPSSTPPSSRSPSQASRSNVVSLRRRKKSTPHGRNPRN